MNRFAQRTHLDEKRRFWKIDLRQPIGTNFTVHYSSVQKFSSGIASASAVHPQQKIAVTWGSIKL
ncbi:hypothetical protein H8E77_33390 [bacterium]|nr:hypothetical protein [bacterium]